MVDDDVRYPVLVDTDALVAVIIREHGALDRAYKRCSTQSKSQFQHTIPGPTQIDESGTICSGFKSRVIRREC
jgi:hypothetical protein